MNTAEVMRKLVEDGLTLKHREGRLVVKGLKSIVQAYEPLIKAHRDELLRFLTAPKCRHCAHAKTDASCAAGHPWRGAELSMPCRDFAVRSAASGPWNPAPRVKCQDCVHFQPHEQAPRDMPGSCGHDGSLQWPWHRTHRCGHFLAETQEARNNASISESVRTDKNPPPAQQATT